MDRNDDWKRKRKVATLPGGAASPQQVLARTLDKAPRIKSVVVGILWDDDSSDFDWSSMKMSDLVWLERAFRIAVTEEIRNPAEATEAVPPKRADEQETTRGIRKKTFDFRRR